ncbi:hypothetical protein MTR67_012619 [Solanum verrucosum]|uniref:Retrotransposon gag domain-containing protein n=1 Tax=Solanum verrucosum TaxID=315347 RepID=A0AAF0QG05_SOLVR|nr:hypothetical protein MTR67_012619 [Solanum verrucosum]
MVRLWSALGRNKLGIRAQSLESFGPSHDSLSQYGGCGPMNPSVVKVVNRVRDFSWMNPLEFHGSKVEKYPQDFIDKKSKVLMIMRVTLVQKEKLVAYKPKGVAHVWSNKWKEDMTVDADPLDWEKFKVVSLDRIFPLEMNEAKVLEFIKLCQVNMSVKEYAFKFT